MTHVWVGSVLINAKLYKLSIEFLDRVFCFFVFCLFVVVVFCFCFPTSEFPSLSTASGKVAEIVQFGRVYLQI